MSRKRPSPSVVLLSFLQNQLTQVGRQGRQAARKLEVRLDTIAFKIRLPLPSDRSCNKTPKRCRWVVSPESYLTADDPRYALEGDCAAIRSRLLAEACEFTGVADVPNDVVEAAESVLCREFAAASARCFQTNEPLSLDDLALTTILATNQVGSAELSVEYRVPLNAGGHHRADNIGWVRPPHEIVLLRGILDRNRVPSSLLDKVQLKAYSTDKFTMPPYFSNRDYRWATWVASPQFASRSDCRGVELQLLAQMLEFAGAPRLDAQDQAAVEAHIERPLDIDGRHCPITGEPIVYSAFLQAAENPRAGFSAYHVGHLIPLTRGGKHDRSNVVWMSDAGNRIQGNDTLDEIVALLQRAAEYHRQRIGVK